ncbi:MAG: hypothetical protein U1E51_01970 [Candidatus Binatia bacterium]|nr:hypothetical protein [Candidatus Binatia bacterium]
MTVEMMSEKELFAAYAKEVRHSDLYEEMHDEINRRVRAEITKQLENDDADCIAAILRGFDEAATWHFDAARANSFEKTIAEAVNDYLSEERDVYTQQHAEQVWDRVASEEE